MDEATERAMRRRDHFTRMEATFPLTIRQDDMPLPDGGRLDEDEFVVRTGQDWQVSIKPLMLTTRRLICRRDPAGREVATLPLGDVREVSLRKHWIGYATIVVETAVDRAFFPAHSGGARIRAQIAAMVEAARRSSAPDRPALRGEAPGDRYDRLRQIGQLKASGVLSDAEFEEEKARILREP
jgi:hypothetical protein